MPYSAKAIANEFLKIAEKNHEPLDHLKLQKLVYYAHGWSLGLLGKPLLEENVEAWPYGPVISSLYHEFKEFGSGQVKRLANEIQYETQSFFQPQVPESDETTHELLDRIWQIYGGYTGFRLSDMTHRPGGPWDQARHGKEGQRRVPMDDNVIKSYFEELAA